MLDFIFQQSVLETIVIVGIVIAIIGIFWKIILIGGTALFCLTVLAKHLRSLLLRKQHWHKFLRWLH